MKSADARQEDPAAPDQVAEAPGEQEQAAEGDQVGVDHPREARGREVQVVWIEGSATFTTSRRARSSACRRTARTARPSAERSLVRSRCSRSSCPGLAGRVHPPSPALLRQVARASVSSSSPVPCSRAAGVSSPSRNTPCSVNVSFVPAPGRLQLDGRDRHRDPRVVAVHLIRVDEPLALDDVLEARDRTCRCAPSAPARSMRSSPPTRKSSSCSASAGPCGPNQLALLPRRPPTPANTRAGAAS